MKENAEPTLTLSLSKGEGAVPLYASIWLGRALTCPKLEMCMATLEFFFDCSSPWTYLAFTRIHDVLARTGAEDRLAADPGGRRVQRG